MPWKRANGNLRWRCDLFVSHFLSLHELDAVERAAGSRLATTALLQRGHVARGPRRLACAAANLRHGGLRDFDEG